MTYLLRANDKGEIVDATGKVVARVVPVKPTPQMLQAWMRQMENLNAGINADWQALLSAATLDIAALAVKVPERYKDADINLGGFRAGFNAALNALEGK